MAQELQAREQYAVISFAGQEAIQSWLKETNSFGRATYWQITRYLSTRFSD